MAECPLMARLVASFIALLGLTAATVAAQSPSAGTGTIFVGSYSGHLTAVDEATGTFTKIPLKTGPPFVVRLALDRTRFYVQSANQERFEVVDVASRQSVDSFTLSDQRRHVRAVAFEVDPQHKTMVIVAPHGHQADRSLGDRPAGVHPLRPGGTHGVADHPVAHRSGAGAVRRGAPLLARRQAALRLRQRGHHLRRRHHGAGGQLGPVAAGGLDDEPIRRRSAGRLRRPARLRHRPVHDAGQGDEAKDPVARTDRPGGQDRRRVSVGAGADRRQHELHRGARAASAPTCCWRKSAATG